ncbi:hypothetical protein I3F58_27210 [Streptomyces sp. MUM 203J]|uniref:hypothetical protein n=1 Tax=Streptomyces sp. MUM 203J TaxID=2791990 RepID=UPI001F0480CA|nr:hypothetical protein [Streptomyces sp. MUM 203J]MCH0543175.1 hypothetical protein [Streptomyces sp. MUM 203J]
MTAAGVRYCGFCDRPIEGEARAFVPESASGAKPTVYYHPLCGPRQAPYVRRHQDGPYSRR